MKVCTYFGNRYLDAYEHHMEEIRDHGFNAILHPINEQDLEFDYKPLQRLLQATKDAGFICQIDPHGIGGALGYGSIATYQADSGHYDRFRTNLKRILDMFGMNAHCVLWDEPDIEDSHMEEIISELSEYGSEVYELGNSVCLWGSPVERCEKRLEILERIPSIDEVGVSLTPQGMLDSKYRADWMVRLKNLKEKYSMVWVPGYNLQKEHLAPMRAAIQEAVSLNIHTIGYWGFRGCEAMGYASSDPARVWRMARFK